MTNNTSTNLATILLVEDEPAVRQLFAQALSRAGYAVYEARNGQEAMLLRAVACGAAFTAILVLRSRTSLDFIYFQF